MRSTRAFLSGNRRSTIRARRSSRARSSSNSSSWSLSITASRPTAQNASGASDGMRALSRGVYPSFSAFSALCKLLATPTVPTPIAIPSRICDASRALRVGRAARSACAVAAAGAASRVPSAQTVGGGTRPVVRPWRLRDRPLRTGPLSSNANRRRGWFDLVMLPGCTAAVVLTQAFNKVACTLAQRLLPMHHAGEFHVSCRS